MQNSLLLSDTQLTEQDVSSPAFSKFREFSSTIFLITAAWDVPRYILVHAYLVPVDPEGIGSVLL